MQLSVQPLCFPPMNKNRQNRMSEVHGGYTGRRVSVIRKVIGAYARADVRWNPLSGRAGEAEPFGGQIRRRISRTSGRQTYRRSARGD
jgi:hypothetical protein